MRGRYRRTRRTGKFGPIWAIRPAAGLGCGPELELGAFLIVDAYSRFCAPPRLSKKPIRRVSQPARLALQASEGSEHHE